jgi:hypothetical protein
MMFRPKPTEMVDRKGGDESQGHCQDHESSHSDFVYEGEGRTPPATTDRR